MSSSTRKCLFDSFQLLFHSIIIPVNLAQRNISPKENSGNTAPKVFHSGKIILIKIHPDKIILIKIILTKSILTKFILAKFILVTITERVVRKRLLDRPSPLLSNKSSFFISKNCLIVKFAKFLRSARSCQSDLLIT